MLSIIHDMIRNVGLCKVLKREKLGKVSFMVQQSMLLAILHPSLTFILYNIICLPLQAYVSTAESLVLLYSQKTKASTT
jgi:hypothetical protein